MTTATHTSVLRRKIAAHVRAPLAAPDPRPLAARGLGRALRHAATPFEGLGLMPGEITVEAGRDLDAAVAALPDHGLIAALEEGGHRGLLALGAGLVDALVEVQTTGRVEAADLPPRAVTRIDEALARDFVDLALAAFARETGGIEGRSWPQRMGYGSRIRDRGQINLLLPEGDYTVFSAELGFAGVARRARLVLVLPTDASLGRVREAQVLRPVDPAWIAARARLIESLRLPLEVVLMRVTRPLSEVQGLSLGDLLLFDPADLQDVALETGDGRVLAHGRLGQLGGRRALRLPPRAGAPPGPGGAAQGPVPPQGPAQDMQAGQPVQSGAVGPAADLAQQGAGGVVPQGAGGLVPRGAGGVVPQGAAGALREATQPAVGRKVGA